MCVCGYIDRGIGTYPADVRSTKGAKLGLTRNDGDCGHVNGGDQPYQPTC